ncbi:MAG: GHKL domain-containing protein [Lachnospiraceae bacterium]|nr:GHKL domain-containing protein [Lachnospiraceae bacterium]
MKLSLRFQYTIAYLLMVIAILGLLNTYGFSMIYDYLETNKEHQIYQEASFLASNYANINASPENGILSMEKQATRLYSTTGIRLWVVDNSGKIITDSFSELTGKNIADKDPEFLSKQSTKGMRPKGIVKEDMLSVIYPLTVSKETRGYLVLMSPIADIRDEAMGYIDTILICYLLFLGLTAIILIYLYWRSVAPLERIGKNAHEYANGHFDVPAAPIRGKEQLAVASAVKYLAEKTHSMSDYQKQFLANVSHDFRSPLTSIRGYADALIDGTIPPEMQEKYLKIIMSETERLSKLTSNLLELNQFESGGLIVELEHFDLHQTIKETISTFEQRCEKKRISLELLLDGKQLFVEADQPKIQRVIQNLVDNAIKFSHTNSVIEIHTTRKHHKVFVSVKDHGIGITREEEQKIWDRFYKSDRSRGKDKTGTGLGLSITKEIIDAHGENINVISTEGVGTEFIFSLTLWEE